MIWRCIEVDINVAYLNALLNEEIYMEFPDGYELLGVDPRFKAGSARVLRLRKALYGAETVGEGLEPANRSIPYKIRV